MKYKKWIHQEPLKKKKKEVFFDFKDVQRKNPRTENKTPTWMYTQDPLKSFMRRNRKFYTKNK